MTLFIHLAGPERFRLLLGSSGFKWRFSFASDFSVVVGHSHDIKVPQHIVSVGSSCLLQHGFKL